ncbi:MULTISPECIES: SURF1 family protein [Rhodopseudomonas]|uniref:SURF1-like protein n=1 Tax=Rhodopseudomonas palustris TaxID=1076 RepID=A0A0D7E7C3_RHOPL|nr:MULTISPECIES: SURF1 family protein [Rhodopseudomonas]KIZ36476.1 surfeit 1 protein [Rhodopseudomonas palustris]MDF3812253.1 SURF1 family protein [Rhodopseudomonas sp. BAL398]WOK17079.1 SURF1 family protein [Rhodopseudomonas sp. BAL398]
MSPQLPRRRGIAGLALITLVMVAVLLSLGFWQLQRRTQKHALIAALTERLAAAPVALPKVADWPTLTPADDEFRRVAFTATYDKRPDAMVYSSGSAVRNDVSGPGTWAFLPARLPGGQSVAINTGFVQNTMQDRAQQDRAVAPLVTGASVQLTGYLRFPDAGGMLTPAADPIKRLWFTRDVPGMAEKLGWSGEMAPFYIDLESPVPASGTPKPGPLSVHLKDDHLQYAITWFGLAAAVAGGFGFWLFGRRRSAAERADRSPVAS